MASLGLSPGTTEPNLLFLSVKELQTLLPGFVLNPVGLRTAIRLFRADGKTTERAGRCTKGSFKVTCTNPV